MDPQRLILEKAVVGDWKRMDKRAKDRFLHLLQDLSLVAQLDEARRVKRQEALRADFLAQLRRAGDQEPGRLLLALYDHEQKLAELYANDLRSQMDTEKKAAERNPGNGPRDP
jgi:hypothetical protein